MSPHHLSACVYYAAGAGVPHTEGITRGVLGYYSLRGIMKKHEAHTHAYVYFIFTLAYVAHARTKTHKQI